MPLVREDDLVASVADALQYISYYHTPDFIAAMGRAYELEQSAPARDAIAQILTNSRLCAEGHRPICQGFLAKVRDPRLKKCKQARFCPGVDTGYHLPYATLLTQAQPPAPLAANVLDEKAARVKHDAERTPKTLPTRIALHVHDCQINTCKLF